MGLFERLFARRTCRALTADTGPLARKFAEFRSFLGHNHEVLVALAELETLYHSGEPVSSALVRRRFQELAEQARALVASLDALGQGRYAPLAAALEGILTAAAASLAQSPDSAGAMVLELDALGQGAMGFAGGKATNLARLRRDLALPTPDGFVVTADAFRHFLCSAGLEARIAAELADFDPDSPKQMDAVSRGIVAMVNSVEVPDDLAAAILAAYEALAQRQGSRPLLAMRSSAVGEDSAASFAGQYHTALGVAEGDLVEAYRAVVASKYAPRAIGYRMRYGLDDSDTPMCVLGLPMVDAVASGVLYTADPGGPERMRLAAVLGLGEQLVSGEASADVFLLSRQQPRILERHIVDKERQLLLDAETGTRLAPTDPARRQTPALPDSLVLRLADWGQRLEDHFGGPQDVEWAMDARGKLFVLQSRPLETSTVAQTSKRLDDPAYPLLLTRGQTASVGCAVGPLYVAAQGRQASDLPDGAILVAHCASPDYAGLVGRMKGLITDVGSSASHLASVAREFGIPAVVDSAGATINLPHGRMVTMTADPPAVYDGVVPQLAECERPRVGHGAKGPAHQRLRTLLDSIAPLNLTDPQAADFSPAGCRSVHDVVRYAHERIMGEMFGLAEGADGSAHAVRLRMAVPIQLLVVDLGGGLRPHLTSCDEITPGDVASEPLRALLTGFLHPGVSWSGSIAVNTGSFLSLMAQSATAELGGGAPGGESYALLARDYLNLSAKFGYHYTNLDALCGEDTQRNHVILQFSGGVGTFAGKSLRLAYLSSVLDRLGYRVRITGDLLEAGIKGRDSATLWPILDQTGRLLATSRLLDMAISSPGRIPKMVERFFAQDYDFLGAAESANLPDFYTHVGDWSETLEDGRRLLVQDGSRWGRGFSKMLAALAGRMMGANAQAYLDNLEAYFYFPLAILKGRTLADGRAEVDVQPLAGRIDQAAGLAFGITSQSDYFVFRVNALTGNARLFQFVAARRHTLAKASLPMQLGQWHQLAVEIRGQDIRCLVDGQEVLRHAADRPAHGHVGLWTKADSVCRFGMPRLLPAGSGG